MGHNVFRIFLLLVGKTRVDVQNQNRGITVTLELLITKNIRLFPKRVTKWDRPWESDLLDEAENCCLSLICG